MNAPLPSHHRGMMFVLSSPSGAGKTTLSRRLLADTQGIVMSVSVTTRTPRPGEVDGKDYFFISPAEYETMVANNALLEHARVFDHHYGTPAHYVHDALERGVDVLFDIDWQGTRQLAQASRNDLVSVFILPPSLGELERRLKTRAQDSDDIVAKRMLKAVSEISHWREYDYVVVNRDLDETLKKIETILAAERLKRVRQTDLAAFVATLA